MTSMEKHQKGSFASLHIKMLQGVVKLKKAFKMHLLNYMLISHSPFIKKQKKILAKY